MHTIGNMNGGRMTRLEKPVVLTHPPEDGPARAFVVELGCALHRFGTPAYRLERAMGAIAKTLKLRSQIFITPTQLMAGFGEGSDQAVHLVRVEPGEINLSKLMDLDELATAVVHQEVGVAEGRQRVAGIVGAPPRFGPFIQVLAFAVASAGAARILGGGAAEMTVAAVIGLLTGVLAEVLPRDHGGGRVFELLSAFMAISVAQLAAAYGVPVSVQSATLAGLIVLIPGLTLTIAMMDIATRNLVSGTAQLMAAAMVFLQIAFGVALGGRVMKTWVGVAESGAGPVLPGWTEPFALGVAIVSIAVLFQAPWRALLAILVAGTSAFYSGRFGASLFGPELGACIGSFMVAAGSNAYARIRNRPALVLLTPGILLLVPGSLGFRSLSSLMERDVVLGIDTAFSMILVAVSLVAGLLVANATVSPRREL